MTRYWIENRTPEKGADRWALWTGARWTQDTESARQYTTWDEASEAARGISRDAYPKVIETGDTSDGYTVPAGLVIPRLPCGCPLDSGCTGYHTDGSIGGQRDD
jgi:hypothetical protein